MPTKVVKVGGSLYDWPELGRRLRAFLEALTGHTVLIIPGGGPTTEAIRLFDRIHHLGEEASHWLALRTLAVNAQFLRQLLPCTGEGIMVMDMEQFARADELRPGKLPPNWEVTSDSLAIRLAVVAGADELILLKSADFPQALSWDEASRQGLVDRYFPQAAQSLPSACAIRLVNLRNWQPLTATASWAETRPGKC